MRDEWGNASCAVTIAHPGTFSYLVSYEALTGKKKQIGKSGFIVVDPLIRLSKRIQGHLQTSHVPIEALMVQTLVPKWMGPLKDWDSHLKAAAALGYNAIHFVPMQKRGASDSPYSISDQLDFADDLFQGIPNSIGTEKREQIVRKKLQGLEEELGMMAITDIVWNHTAHTSEWLQGHPEAGYNLVNSPHLEPAFELDRALQRYSSTLDMVIATEEHVSVVMQGIRDKVLPEIKLWQYYVINVDTSLLVFEAFSRTDEAQQLPPANVVHDEIPFKQAVLAGLFDGPEHAHNGPANTCFEKKLSMDKTYAYVLALLKTEQKTKHEAVARFKQLLNDINIVCYEEYDKDMTTMLTQVQNDIQYNFVDAHGPRKGRVTLENPFVGHYFTHIPKNEHTAKHPQRSLYVANNGWVWDADPKLDFASAESRAYLLRQVIVWGDCVKLRYGQGPKDNPWLWQHMTKYSEQCARLFHGLRIDNCHSTPIHAAEHFLDAARKVRPDLFVMAELFTGSEAADEVYVTRLGLNALIREAMQPGDAFELSRIVHRYGGRPFGSLKDSHEKHDVHKLWPSRPHALFFDCTHDNETPMQKRTIVDALPNAALVAMSVSAVGSVRGYDECYPKLLHLVNEKRPYSRLVDALPVGIGRAKKQLNDLHYKMTMGGYAQIHVHHENDYIIVHRMNPKNGKGYLLVAHTAFTASPNPNQLAPIQLEAKQVTQLFAYKLVVQGSTSSKDELSGVDVALTPLEPFSITSTLKIVSIHVPTDFSRGAIAMFETVGACPPDQEELCQGAGQAMDKLSALDLNVVLYRSAAEEADATGGHGAYNFPGYGDTVYCGIQGLQYVFEQIVQNDDLGHPVCDNIRQGNWLMDYTVDRLTRYTKRHPNVKELIAWYKAKFSKIKQAPRYMHPRLVILVVNAAYQAAKARAFHEMATFVRTGDEFVKALALCSVQLFGGVESAGLHPFDWTGSLAAGLPHFSTHHMRCWGRDVFISMKGLLLATGRYKHAHNTILAFASTLKHGMIPNLLDSQRRPRYNARDSVWWFLQAVQDYCKTVTQGIDILHEKVKMRFDNDDYIEPNDPRAYVKVMTLEDIVQNTLQAHATGIAFREWNAGSNLDHAMQDEGFNVTAKLDPSTGFIHGGNAFNCGTWMDKMGESHQGGNYGVPSTPRDGAAIELVGMTQSTVEWLAQLHAKGKFKYGGVDVVVQGKKQHLSYNDWNKTLQVNFEKHFCVPTDGKEMYKDTVGSSGGFTDNQLRPNVCVAMVVAPELFNKTHAQQALRVIQQQLQGPLGMRTLDPQDPHYRGDYDAGADSNDRTVAKGANYHQGPEWLWCTGFFYQAYIKYCCTTDQDKEKLRQSMLTLREALHNSPWKGLPELTNANGKPCPSSCPTQAWSAATMLDVLHLLQD